MGIFLRADKQSGINLSNSMIADLANLDDVSFTETTFTSDFPSIIEESSYGGSRTGDSWLLPLSDNCGATPAHTIRANCIARNTGILATCIAEDQRVQLRNDGDGKCDVGAVGLNAHDIENNGFL